MPPNTPSRPIFDLMAFRIAYAKFAPNCLNDEADEMDAGPD